MTPHRRGFTVIEILAVLVLFGLVATVAARMFTQTLEGISQQRLREWKSASDRSLVESVREDVWLSTSIAAKGGELTLQRGGRSITYRVEPACVRRYAPGEREARWEMRDPLQFSASGSMATLQMPARTVCFLAPAAGAAGGGR